MARMKRKGLKPAKRLSDEALLRGAAASATRHQNKTIKQKRAERADRDARRSEPG